MPGWLVDDPRKIKVNYIYVSTIKKSTIKKRIF